jgi:predicted nucleic acid-binding protein
MPIVCDTSVLSYLILIDEVEVLPALYGEVLIPEEVAAELRHPQGPKALRTWMEALPGWLQVEASNHRLGSDVEDVLRTLDPGERAAIRLAADMDASLIVMDEKAGRRIAQQLGLSVTGTIGILDLAASEGWIDVVRVIEQLKDTSFRAAPALYRWLLERHA